MSETEQEVPFEEPEAPDEATGGDETPDEAEDEDEATPEPAEPQNAAQSMSEAEREKAYKRIEQSYNTYVRAVGKNLEEDANDLVPCLLCSSTPHPAFLNQNDAGRVPQEVVDGVKLFLGFAREVEYRQSSQHRTCDLCGGEGQVSTGSHVPQWKSLACPACKGYGFVPPPGQPVNGADAQAAAEVMPLSNPPIPDLVDTDPSGEPRILPDGRENPNFGKWPQFKVPVPPWGVTANLTAQDAPA